MTKLEFCVQTSGTRIDAFLAACTEELTRSAAALLIADGAVLCNQKPVAKSYKVMQGDVVCVCIPDPQPIETLPQEIPIDIVYEDTCLLVVNKAKGMVVHPAAGNLDRTLVNALLYHCAGSLSGINGKLRPGIVHRIDKDTSGLLVVAKDDKTHAHLAQQFAVHSILREYRAIVYGTIAQDTGFIEAPIGRHPTERKRMAITDKNGKYAYTSYKVTERLCGFTHVALALKTGRTHQIRVHMASIAHPVAGDAVYGPKKCITALAGQCLHAKTLGFVHPETGEEMLFTSELPTYFTSFLATVQE